MLFRHLRVVCAIHVYYRGIAYEQIVNAYQSRATQFGGKVQWYNEYGSGPTATSFFESADFIALGQALEQRFLKR